MSKNRLLVWLRPCDSPNLVHYLPSKTLIAVKICCLDYRLAKVLKKKENLAEDILKAKFHYDEITKKQIIDYQLIVRYIFRFPFNHLI
jgi:hypothetical protein